MNIVFKKIQIYNFMSIKEAEINLENRGTLLVKGINEQDEHAESNGSGKSALTNESILWCLTGDTNKKAKTINNLFVVDGIAKVTLDFSIDNSQYSVTRINDKNKSLIVMKDGKNISGNTYTKSKEVLDQELGFINKDILTSIILLGQGLKDRFSELKASERKTRLEYLVGIDNLLTNIQNSLDSSESRINGSINETNMKITEQNTIVSTSQQVIDNYKNRPSMDETEYKETKKKFNELADKGSQIQTQLEDIKKKTQDLLLEKDKYNDELVKINKNITDAESKIKIYNNSKITIEKNIKDVEDKVKIAEKAECPTCHQHLQDDKVLSELNKSLKSYNTELKDLDKEYDIKKLQKDIDNNRETYNTTNTTIQNIQVNINNLVSEQTQLTQELNQITIDYNKYNEYFKEYDKYKAESNSYEQVSKDAQIKISNANKELNGLEETLTKFSRDKDINKFFKSNVSRKFRNFLLEGVFTYLNQKLAYYSKKLFTDYIIKLENDGNNIDIRIGDKYFEDLSGGEQRRVDVAIQFALRDLARNQRGLNCSLLCIDEVFDYLDATGIKIITDFVQSETQDVSTMFITSHMKNAVIDCDGIIQVTKGKNQISTVEEIM